MSFTSELGAVLWLVTLLMLVAFSYFPLAPWWMPWVSLIIYFPLLFLLRDETDHSRASWSL